MTGRPSRLNQFLYRLVGIPDHEEPMRLHKNLEFHFCRCRREKKNNENVLLAEVEVQNMKAILFRTSFSVRETLKSAFGIHP